MAPSTECEETNQSRLEEFHSEDVKSNVFSGNLKTDQLLKGFDDTE